MNIKHFILIVLLAIASPFLFLSCEEERDGYARPSFGEMIQEPNPVAPGDIVTLTIPQEAKGNGIAGITYTWTIQKLTPNTDGGLEDFVKEEHTNYDGYGKQNPTIKFQVPADAVSGAHNVHMKADCSCYIDDVLFDAFTVYGKITIK